MLIANRRLIFFHCFLLQLFNNTRDKKHGLAWKQGHINYTVSAVANQRKHASRTITWTNFHLCKWTARTGANVNYHSFHRLDFSCVSACTRASCRENPLEMVAKENGCIGRLIFPLLWNSMTFWLRSIIHDP